MQYIKKQNTPPDNWEDWFTTATGLRSYDYSHDTSSLTNLIKAREFLLHEQNGLCAYCQSPITIENSSIEHVLPKSLNKENSTGYYNLVAVCKPHHKDSNGLYHCDKSKMDRPLTPFIFFSDSNVSKLRNNKYFTMGSDGQLRPHHQLPNLIKNQVETFIEILNLNHDVIRQNREKDVLGGIIEASRAVRADQKNLFWRSQFESVLNDSKKPYRQFLLIYIGNRLGIN